MPRRLLVVLLLALLGVAGCTDASSQTASGPTTQQPTTHASGAAAVRRYVALGDSYTSAPYVGITDLAGGCLRSQQNYPRLLAKAHHLHLVDVSCAAATTANVMKGQRPLGSEVRLRAQIRSVTAGTDLVTVGIGGNDQGLFRNLVSGCQEAKAPMAGRCTLPTGTELAPQLRRIGTDVTALLEEVHRRAPRATVVLVGYPRLLDGHTCPGRVPLDRAASRQVAQASQALRDTLQAAARAAGADFLDMYAASRGHDICSRTPWVNGERTEPGKAAALHPFAVEQQAVADRLGALVFG